MKSLVFWKHITLTLFLLTWVVVAVAVTHAVIDDILHYDDRFTSFPPFSNAVIFSMVTAPLLLLTLAVHAVVTKVSSRRADDAPPAPETLRKRYRITARTAAAAMAILLVMVLAGTFLPVLAGSLSAFLVGLRLQYLCVSYAPLFLTACLFWWRAATRLKKLR